MDTLIQGVLERSHVAHRYADLAFSQERAVHIHKDRTNFHVIKSPSVVII